MRSRRGLTLIELLVSTIIMAVLATALCYAFTAGVNMQRLTENRAAAAEDTRTLERHLTEMLQGAKLTSTTTDLTSYFLGTIQYGNDTDIGIDRLTFTTAAPGVPVHATHSTDDFETQFRDYGPVGGIAEVSWGTTPIGSGGGKSGLFERIQRPSDEDPSQGGLESLLSPDVDRIGFQFWNGTDWVDTWDTVNGQRRLPAAVRVNYTLRSDPRHTPHLLVVPIPESDVDANSPSTNGQ